jgi:uncharacterized protein (TIGR03437 family)
MKRLAIALLLPLLAGSLWSQTISGTRIFTEPSGAGFYVDEMYYTGPVNLLWAERTVHTLRVAPLTEVTPENRIACSNGWVDSTGQYMATAPVTTILADPKVTYYKTSCSRQFKFKLSFFACGDPDIAKCGGGVGQVLVDGVAYDRDAELWVAPGSVLKLQAMPAKGYAFIRWELGLTSDTSFLTTVTVNGPMTLPVRFEPAKEIVLRTEPPGLKVLADRQPLQTPVTLYWAYGSKHTLGSVSPQTNTTASDWMFDSWDNGADDNFVHTVGTGTTPETFTARYVRGARASFLTSPRGLKLNIDGRDNWPAYNFLWGIGSKHTIAAPLEQIDAKGRRYTFKGWSNGASATQEMVMDASMIPIGPTLIASYDVMGRVTLDTNPPGFPITVEGTACNAPCVLDRPSGGQLTIGAPSSVPFTESTRFDFTAWSDGGPRERTLSFSTDEVKLTAAYQTSFLLRAVADPSEGASILLDPVSTDGYYAADTFISATAEAKPGFKFRRWDGDAAGTFNKTYLTLSGPRAIRANLDRTPYVAPAGVRNAAGETPQTGIASGSIASIMGESLGGEILVAESNPLPQTLGNVTVLVGDRILPLFYVSPTQINVQIPSGLTPGDYTLTVKWEGHPEVTAQFTIVRNAPGLFGRLIDNRAYMVALHEDGTPITLESPARRAETITILGTGIGPYTKNSIDGFAVPKGTVLPLADVVEVVAGDLVMQPLWSGAAVGYVGANAVRMRIGDELPAASTVECKVRVNGVESNKVLLPIE